jgi:hypothetical protein
MQVELSLKFVDGDGLKQTVVKHSIPTVPRTSSRPVTATSRAAPDASRRQTAS